MGWKGGSLTTKRARELSEEQEGYILDKVKCPCGKIIGNVPNHLRNCQHARTVFNERLEELKRER